MPKWWIWTLYLAAAIEPDGEAGLDLLDEAAALSGGDLVLSSWMPADLLANER